MKQIRRNFQDGWNAFGSQRIFHPLLPNQNVPHYHRTFEFYLVLRGVCRILVDRNLYSLREGSLAWLPPGQVHVVTDQSHDFMMSIFSFRAAFVRKLRLTPESGTTQIRTLSPEQTARLSPILTELKNQDVSWETACPGFIYVVRLLWDFLKQKEIRKPEKKLHPAVRETLQLLLERNLALSLEDFAMRVKLSPSELSRLFRDQTGVSLTEYRNRLRVKEFFRIYADGSRYNISEAIYRADFGSYAQFYRVFQHVTGLTPRQYQERNRTSGK